MHPDGELLHECRLQWRQDLSGRYLRLPERQEELQRDLYPSAGLLHDCGLPNSG